ncbi:hypothetical protein ACIQ6K_39315, partial [Streptomyces sp. NPDC096354]|uniref:hypothetical protein n=1 Tax=Streptomyces sp. NPDC096354 TaxID=3366088 RepID=UPI00380AE9A1
RFMARPNSTSEDRPVESLTSLSMLDTITGAFNIEGAFNHFRFKPEALPDGDTTFLHAYLSQ